jgi:thiamine kinase-like enzyme
MQGDSHHGFNLDREIINVYVDYRGRPNGTVSCQWENSPIGEVPKLKKGQKIGTGRTAEIFEWGDNRVLKLFFDWVNPNWITKEEMLSKRIRELGLPAPYVEGIEEVEGKKGIIFELVDGISMLDSLLDDIKSGSSDIAKHADILAELHASINSNVVDDFPPLRSMISRAVQYARKLPDNIRQRAEKILESLPDSNALCHYDFHPGNIILTREGPVVIDWMTASQGNPHADIARTLLILRSGDPPTEHMPADEFNELRESLIERYLSRYSEMSSISRSELDAWMFPVTAARLDEEIEREEENLLAMLNNRMR